MFRKYMKTISQLIVVSLLGALMSASLVYTHIEQSRIPTSSEFRANHSTTNAYPVSSKAAVKRSISSAVRIISFNMVTGEVSVSSGTYFEHKESYYILTVRHGIVLFSCDAIQIEVDGVLHPCNEIISHDEYNDYAMLSVDKIPNRDPIRFPKDFVSKFREWQQVISPLEPLIYTGFPNTIGPVTLSGRVMGMSPDEYVYFNSYAWSGSSGSGVFSSKGKFMGYIVALDVGRTEYGMDVLENVILVVPHYRIDWSPIIRKGN
tara:strand:- start:984 stop:1769 length:786 start_codon:yes stop_codon:yes gene_type:complete